MRTPVLILAAMLGGCAADQHALRRSDDPDQADRDVRFRSTHYFRVFDYCEPPALPADPDRRVSPLLPLRADSARVLNDTLYRYTLIGRAAALTSTVRFEAGTVPAHSIDPFGATVVYDEDSDALLVRTAENTREKAEEAEKRERIEWLLTSRERVQGNMNAVTNIDSQIAALYGYTPSEPKGEAKSLMPDTPPAVGAGTKEQSEAPASPRETLLSLSVNLQELANEQDDLAGEVQRLGLSPILEPKQLALFSDSQIRELESTVAANDQAISQLIDKVEIPADGEERDNIENAQKRARAFLDKFMRSRSTTDAQTTAECAAGTVRRRGYRILGPEGWRTFDPDQRLILAMRASGRPLIEVMNEIAARTLAARGDSVGTELAFTKAQLRAEKARQLASKVSPENTEAEKLKTTATQIQNLLKTEQ